MSSHLEPIEREIPRDAIRASVAGTNMAVVLTQNQLLIGRAGLGGPAKVRRYPLTTLTAVRCVRDTRGDLLALEFNGVDSCVGLFPPDAQGAIERLVGLLDCPVKKILQLGASAVSSFPVPAVAA